MIEDFPDYGKVLTDLIKTPQDIEMIEYIGMGFNDLYNLKPLLVEGRDDDALLVTKDNFMEFMELNALHLMKKNILRKNIDFPRITQDGTQESDEEYNTRYHRISELGEIKYNSLAEGIPNKIKDYIGMLGYKDDNIKRPLTLATIETLLTLDAISLEIVQKLKANLHSSMNERVRQINDTTYQNDLRSLTTDFADNVLTVANVPNYDETEYLNFIQKLLRFWTGLSFYKENEKYTLDTNPSMRNQSFPQSHTCFFRIDYPKLQQRTNYNIYQKTLEAVSCVEEGLGLAGGKKSSKKHKSSSSKPKSSKIKNKIIKNKIIKNKIIKKKK
jgi:hypothetical protein